MKKLLYILLSFLPLVAWANEEQMDGLHCGDVVTITATPDRGYRFVSWSDGVTDNPREIEITEAVELTPIYEQTCVSDTVPVLWLYGQLLVVNVDSMQRKGYLFSEQSVNWYRIVGDIDAAGSETNDSLLATGYYYNPQSLHQAKVYAAVDVSQTPPGEITLCTNTLYSAPVDVNNKGGGGDTVSQPILQEENLRLAPNYGKPGMQLKLTGLITDRTYTIDIYDAVGKNVLHLTTTGQESVPITAPYYPGYYVLRALSDETKTVMRLIVVK